MTVLCPPDAVCSRAAPAVTELEMRQAIQDALKDPLAAEGEQPAYLVEALAMKPVHRGKLEAALRAPDSEAQGPRVRVRPEDVGLLKLGSAPLLDRSKSIKSELTALIEAGGCVSTEGVDACSDSVALLGCMRWVQSSG